MKWNDDWRTELKKTNTDCWDRLCSCCNNVNDVILMARYMHKYNPTVTKEDCFVRMIEWCCDWNNQTRLYDRIDENYYEYLGRV